MQAELAHTGKFIMQAELAHTGKMIMQTTMVKGQTLSWELPWARRKFDDAT